LLILLLSANSKLKGVFYWVSLKLNGTFPPTQKIPPFFIKFNKKTTIKITMQQQNKEERTTSLHQQQ
jgi:hypothetical protein